MKPLKFYLAAEFDHSHREIETNLPELLEVAKKFSENMERLRLTVIWPMALMAETVVDEQMSVRAAESMGLSRFDNRLTYPETALHTPTFKEWKRRKADMNEKFRSVPESQIVIFQLGSERIEMLAKTKTGGDAGEMTLLSVAILAWTYFEVLFEDLHRAATTHYPSAFPHLSKSQKYSFQKREIVRRTYKDTFNDNGVNAALGELAFDGLALLRNLLVHKVGGVVDAKFKDECSQLHFDGWAELSVGVPIRITGEMIQSLLSPAVKAGCRLINAIDDWVRVRI